MYSKLIKKLKEKQTHTHKQTTAKTPPNRWKCLIALFIKTAKVEFDLLEN